jgi:hypothetical protein
LARDYTKYLTWLKQEFAPLTLATPDTTIAQIVENSIRYWNQHSAYKLSTMVDYAPGTKRVQLNKQFKTVVDCYPDKTTTWIWNDHPLWTLLGITLLDNITGDLILMSEAFRNYRVYVGTDLQWIFEKSDDPGEGGYFYAINVPNGTSKLYIVGTKRITEDEDVLVEQVLDWIYRYSKALLKQIEGNTLRKAAVANVPTDGQEMINEGREEMKDLQHELEVNGRWVVLARRM